MRLDKLKPGHGSTHALGTMAAALVTFLGCTTEEPGPMASNTTMSADTTSPTTSPTDTATPTGDTSAVDTTAGSVGCDDIVGEGFAVGQIAENWTLQDENGADVSLYDYCGNVIFIEIGAEW